MKRISNILNDKMKPMWRLTLACLTFFALAGNALAQGNDGLFVIKKTNYNNTAGVHYLAHVRVGDNYVLQDATSFSPDCLWYSGREYNLMGTNHNYYFIDHLGEPRFLMAPLVSGGALAISDSKPPVYLLNNTDHNYYFYDWDYDNRPEGAGVARGHQYNGITNQTDCEACAGGQWDDGDAECWAVYWVECNGTTWSLSTVSQYNITTNSGRFRRVTDVLTPMEITSMTGGLDDLDDIVIEYTDPAVGVGLSASITGSFEYIPAYHQYDFTEVTNPDATDPEERFTEYTYYYYNGETYTSAPSASISSGATPSVTYYWSIYGAGADYI